MAPSVMTSFPKCCRNRRRLQKRVVPSTVNKLDFSRLETGSVLKTGPVSSNPIDFRTRFFRKMVIIWHRNLRSDSRKKMTEEINRL